MTGPSRHRSGRPPGAANGAEATNHLGEHGGGLGAPPAGARVTDPGRPGRGAPVRRTATEAAAHQQAWRMQVQVRLGAPWGHNLTWSSGTLPALTCLARLVGAPAFAGLPVRALLLDESDPTTLERADGNWEAALQGIANPAADASLDDLAAAFNTHIWPSRTQPRTRERNWAHWTPVVTWAIARGATNRLMPMNRDTLKALSWDFLMMGASRSQIVAVWSAVQSRHMSFGFDPPIQRRGEFTIWTRSLGHIMGRPMALKLPIHRSIVARLLRWHPERVAVDRDRLLTVLATIACLRVSEVARLQACDVWFDHFTGMGIPGYEGTCGIFVAYRKNDSERRGHIPGLGRARDPALDVVSQLRTWMRQRNLVVRAGCTKRARPAARCPSCWPLFSRTITAAGGAVVATERALSAQMVGDAIRRSAEAAGCDARRFSGVSARKGGLSTAIEAGVEEVILYLQTGHGPERAARRYMHLRDPARLLQTFEAFRF